MENDKQDLAPAAPGAPAPHMLTFDEIMGAQDIQTEIVEMPEWGGAVELRSLTLEQVESARTAATVIRTLPGGTSTKDVNEDTFAFSLIAAASVSPTLTLEEARALKGKAAAPVDRLAKAVLRLSGLTQEAAHQAKKSAGA